MLTVLIVKCFWKKSRKMKILLNRLFWPQRIHLILDLLTKGTKIIDGPAEVVKGVYYKKRFLKSK